MITTHPSIMLGSYVWDQDWLPADEFRLRSAALEKVMERRGWAGLLVYGDAREHAALAWASNFIPRMRWAMVLIPRTGEPRLLISISSRDMPAMRTMTWVGDVCSGWEWKRFDAWAERLAPGSVLGTVGFDLITPLLHGQVDKSLHGRATLAEADAELAGLRRVQRPREVALIRRSAACAREASEVLQHSWQPGTAAESALLAVERHARGLGVQDVRTLLSIDGGRTLRPYRGTFDERPEAMVAYLGVKLLGYWAEQFVTLADRARRIDGVVAEALSALVEAVRPGMTGGELHAIARRKLGDRPLHPALSGSVGARIGLSLVDGPAFTDRSVAAVAPGNVYALRVGTVDAAEGGAIASAMVAVDSDGASAVLARSPASP